MNSPNRFLSCIQRRFIRSIRVPKPNIHKTKKHKQEKVAINSHEENEATRALRKALAHDGIISTTHAGVVDGYEIYGGCLIERMPVLLPEVSQEMKDLEWADNHRWSGVLESLPEYLKEDLLKKAFTLNPNEFRPFRPKSKTSNPDLAIKTSYDIPGVDISQYEYYPPLDFDIESIRYTEDDKSNFKRSLFRKLDRSLLLIVKLAHNDGMWSFPQILWKQSESIRETCERAANMYAGAQLHMKFTGFCPVAYTYHEYDSNSKDKDITGRKSFFLRALYEKGNVLIDQDIEDFAWVPVEELPDYIDKKTYETVSQLYLL